MRKEWLVARAIGASLLLLLLAGGRAQAQPNPIQEFPPSFGKPQGITSGPDGNIWFVEETASKVAQMDRNGNLLREVSLPAGSSPQGIVSGPDGNLWFTEPGTSKIGKVDRNGVLLGEFAVTTGTSPQQIVVGPDGNLWFNEEAGNRIGKMNTAGALLGEFPVGGSPPAITVGPCADGNVWFSERSGRVGKIDTSGRVTELGSTLGGSNFRGITAGPSGDCSLYVADRGNSTIVKFSAAGQLAGTFALSPGAEPIGIVAGPDGNIWFTENAVNAIGQMTPGGVLRQEIPVPRAATFPDGITVGPDGNIWFTEAGGNRVGRVSVGGSITPTPTPTPTPTSTPTPTPTPGNVPDLQISKTVSVVTGVSGAQKITYSVSWANAGNVPASGAVVTENVPIFTTFSLAGSTGGWSCVPGRDQSLVGGGVCRLDLGSISAKGGGNATFAVEEGKPLFPFPVGFDVYNDVSIADDGSRGPDANPDDNQFGIAYPDTTCISEADPVKYVLCYIHNGVLPSRTWVQRVISRIGALFQELRLYFRFRDQMLGTSPAWRKFYGFYRTYSPEVRSLLGTDVALRAQAVRVVNAWEPAVQALLAGNGATTAATQEMVTSLVAFFDRLREIASADFRAHLNFPRMPSFVGHTLDQTSVFLDQKPCVAGDENLCLMNGRFRVETRWRDLQGNTGVGHAVPLTGDAGYFWFFSNTNVEIVVKALNGCGVDGRFWVFAGGLTNVELTMTVTDTVTGQVKNYVNPASEAFLPVLDTAAFATCQAAAVGAAARKIDRSALDANAAASVVRSPVAREPAAADACSAGPTVLCLDSNRYLVEATWQTRDGVSGAAQAVPLTGDSGYFWFFDPGNIELIVKVLNGCVVNSRQWVFAAGVTDVRVTLKVTDTVGSSVRLYQTAQGTPFQPILDTSAFLGCP